MCHHVSMQAPPHTPLYFFIFIAVGGNLQIPWPIPSCILQYPLPKSQDILLSDRSSYHTEVLKISQLSLKCHFCLFFFPPIHRANVVKSHTLHLLIVCF